MATMSRRKPELAILQSSALINSDRCFEKYSPPRIKKMRKAISNAELAQAFGVSIPHIQRYVQNGVDRNFYNPKVRPKMLELYALIQKLIREEGTDKNTVAMFRNKFNENSISCPEGMINRIQSCLESGGADSSVPALLAAIRKDIAEKVSTYLGFGDDKEGIHRKTVVRIVLNKKLHAGIPTAKNSVKDKHAESFLRREPRLSAQVMSAASYLFKEYYTPHRIVEELFKSAFLSRGCRDYLQADDSDYEGSAMEAAYTFYAKVLNIKDEPDESFQVKKASLFISGDVTIDEEETLKTYALKKSRVISDTITHFFKEGVFEEDQLSKGICTEYNNTTLNLHIDESNIKNTLIQFKRKDGETTQFFLGNAHHFSLDIKDVLDTSYMLEKEDKKALIDLINTSKASPEIKRELKAQLATSGFDVDLTTQEEKEQLRSQLGNIKGVLKQISKLPEKQQKNALVKHTDLMSSPIEKIDDLARLLTFAKKNSLSTLSDTLLKENGPIAILHKDLEGENPCESMFEISVLCKEKYPTLGKDIENAFLKLGPEVKNKHSGDTTLIIAIKTGQTDLALKLIEKSEQKKSRYSSGAARGVDTRNGKGETALILAAKTGNEKVFKDLLKKGASIYFTGGKERYYALDLAAKAGHTTICDMMISIEIGPDADYSKHRPSRLGKAILASIEGGHKKICKNLLCSLGERASTEHLLLALSTATEKNYPVITGLISESLCDNQPTHKQVIRYSREAVESGNTKMSLAIAKVNPKFFKKNKNWLIGLAAVNGHTETVNTLITESDFDFDSFLKTPSKIMSRTIKKEVLKLFCKHKNINVWVEKTADHYLGDRAREAKTKEAITGNVNKKSNSGRGTLNQENIQNHRLKSIFGIPFREKRDAAHAFAHFIKKPTFKKLTALKKCHWRALNQGRLKKRLLKPYLMHQKRNGGFKQRFAESSLDAWFRTQKKELSESPTQQNEKAPLNPVETANTANQEQQPNRQREQPGLRR